MPLVSWNCPHRRLPMSAILHPLRGPLVPLLHIWRADEPCAVRNTMDAMQGNAGTHMTEQDEKTEQVEALLATPDMAGALESEQFKRFLDQIPIAIIVSDMTGRERIA